MPVRSEVDAEARRTSERLRDRVSRLDERLAILVRTVELELTAEADAGRWMTVHDGLTILQEHWTAVIDLLRRGLAEAIGAPSAEKH